MKILHFSDLHNNQRAIEAAIHVAQKWQEASIAITGDVVNGSSEAASYLINEFPNPHIWLVRGNHDEFPENQFGHLVSVEWRAPYLVDDLQNCVLIGLDSEREDGIVPQLVEISPTKCTQQNVLIVLHHRPFSLPLIQTIISWAKIFFPSIVSIVFMHGHEHHDKSFHAKVDKKDFEGIHIIISHVYSANMNNKRVYAGCANLLNIRNDGNISVKKVYSI